MNDKERLGPILWSVVGHELLFRVWDVRRSMFLQPVGTFGQGGINFYCEQHSPRTGQVSIDWFLQDHNLGLGNFYVQRATDMVDQHTRRIFEGDLVEVAYEDEGGAVYTNELLVVWCHKHSGWRGFDAGMINREAGGRGFNPASSKVIGNVFETEGWKK